MSCVYCYCVRFRGPGICHVCIATVLDSVDQVYVMCVLLRLRETCEAPSMSKDTASKVFLL